MNLQNQKVQNVVDKLSNDLRYQMTVSLNHLSPEARSYVYKDFEKYDITGTNALTQYTTIMRLITMYNIKYPRTYMRKVHHTYIGAKRVYQFDKSGKLINKYRSIQEAHRVTGISDGSICYCCNKRNGFKTAGGYYWSFDKNYVI